MSFGTRRNCFVIAPTAKAVVGMSGCGKSCHSGWQQSMAARSNDEPATGRMRHNCLSADVPGCVASILTLDCLKHEKPASNDAHGPLGRHETTNRHAVYRWF
jgi:hypothetical protein